MAMDNRNGSIFGLVNPSYAASDPGMNVPCKYEGNICVREMSGEITSRGTYFVVVWCSLTCVCVISWSFSGDVYVRVCVCVCVCSLKCVVLRLCVLVACLVRSACQELVQLRLKVLSVCLSLQCL